MSTVWYVILFSLVGSVISLSGGVALLGQQERLGHFTKLAVPFAAGALLSAVFFDLLVEGIEIASPSRVLQFCLVGIVGFFVLERLTHWFHHHHEEDIESANKSPMMIIVADTLHNALDGIAIASAFLISVPVGVVSTIAIAAHEVPQEIGDFGVLLSKGMKPRRVLLVNLVSAFATVAAALITFRLGNHETLPIGPLLGLSSGFLLYIAMSDLIPTIHHKKSKRGVLDSAVVMFAIGLMTVWLAIQLAERFIAH